MAKDVTNSRVQKIGVFEKPLQSLSELISRADLAYILPQFDYRKVVVCEYPDRVHLSLLNLGYPIGNDNVLPTLQRLGYNPGYFVQLLLVAIAHPELQSYGLISAQGSRWAYRCSDGQCSSKYHCDHVSNLSGAHKKTEITTAYLGVGAIGESVQRYLNFACPTEDFVWDEKARFLIWEEV